MRVDRVAGQGAHGSVSGHLARWIACLALAVLVGALQGCAVNRSTGSVTPDRDIATLKTFYVVKFVPDGRGINELIANDLQRRGYVARTGPEGNAPKDVDAVVNYIDKWMWDITMYMLELTVEVREPGTGAMLATGNAYHTSLTRLTPPEMVTEVLDNIFTKPGGRPAPSTAPLSSGNMLLAIPAYQTVAAVASAPQANVRMDPVRDARKSATGSLVGERSALSVSMGKVDMSPLPVEMVGQVLRTELAAKGVRTVDTDEAIVLRPLLTKFDVRTPSTMLYWDMNGVIAVDLTVAARDGKAQELKYEVNCTDRTYAGPSQALLTKLVSACLGNLGKAIREDAALAAALAAR